MYLPLLQFVPIDFQKEILIGGIGLVFGLVPGLVLALVGYFLARPKTEAEVKKTISEKDKNYQETIANLNEQLNDAQEQKLEVLEKLDVWIQRYTDTKEDWHEIDNELAATIRQLADCLSEKDDKCKKCLKRFFIIFDKFENSLVTPENSAFVEEMNRLREDLKKE